MSSRATTARRWLERTGGHPVVTLDLDPEEFATAPTTSPRTRCLRRDQSLRSWASE